MENHETLSGIFIRILMKNQSKSLPTKKLDIRKVLKVSSKDMALLVVSSQKYLTKLGLELVGIDKSGVADPAAAGKYFLRRLNSPIDVELPTEEFRRLILVFTFIILEQLSMETSKLWFFLKNTSLFQDETEFNNFLNWSRRQGYLRLVKVDENFSVMLGWRYHCDFRDFDPKNYFQNYNKQLHHCC